MTDWSKYDEIGEDRNYFDDQIKRQERIANYYLNRAHSSYARSEMARQEMVEGVSRAKAATRVMDALKGLNKGEK